MIYSTQRVEIISKCQKKTFFKSLFEARFKMSQGKMLKQAFSSFSLLISAFSSGFLRARNPPAPLQSSPSKPRAHLTAAAPLAELTPTAAAARGADSRPRQHGPRIAPTREQEKLSNLQERDLLSVGARLRWNHEPNKRGYQPRRYAYLKWARPRAT